MKKIIILALALAGATGSVLSQQTIIRIDDVAVTKTEQMFQDYQFLPAHVKFDFNFTKGNRMTIQLSSLTQLDSLPSLDSLFSEVKKALRLLDDTTVNPIYNKRVDYITTHSDARVRIKNYPPSGNIYSLRQNNEVTELKVEQDTLRISLYTMDQVFTTNDKKKIIGARRYHLTFYLNNLSDFNTLPIEKLNATIDILKAEIAPSKAKESKHYGIYYYALYDVETQKKQRTSSNKTLRSTKVRVLPDPYVQSGFQFVRGVAVPSAGVGIQLFQKKSETSERAWRLMWEPLFFFSRDANNKVTMDRNDFITFKQHSESSWKGTTKEIEFVQNVSVGYLIRRKGNWLEKNTIKFSLPTGIQYKNILLEPEFVFNDFFRNFSPSLKLTVVFE
jgi:hypothetical protein